MNEPTGAAEGCDRPIKQCGRCEETKPLDEFPSDPRGKDGHKTRCLPCDAEMRRQTARRKEWRRKHKADFRKLKEYTQRSYDALRAQVFDHYGWSCACWGSADRPSIDHIDGKGRQHRIE